MGAESFVLRRHPQIQLWEESLMQMPSCKEKQPTLAHSLTTHPPKQTTSGSNYASEHVRYLDPHLQEATNL